MRKSRAGVVIYDEELNILLIFRRKNNKEYWVIPGGGIEKDEEPEVAAIREIKEETGMNIEIERKLTELVINEVCEYYFMAKTTNKDVSIEGEEKERNTIDNYYELQWIGIEKLKNIKLLPQEVKECILRVFER